MTQRSFFGTDGIRGPAGSPPLDPEMVARLGAALARCVAPTGGESGGVVIGRDTRESGNFLENAMAAGLQSQGVDVYRAGVIPTPAVACLVREQKAAAGVVISASHNPFHDNGIKLFGAGGGKLDDADEAAIEKECSGDRDHTEHSGGFGRDRVLEDAAETYRERILASVDHDSRLLQGVRIALDNANGAAVRTSAGILEALGAEVLVFHDRPDGRNINAECGCTHPGVIESLVRETGADVGVSHDGDADRVLLCDESGSVLDGDEFMAIAAIDLIERGLLRENTLVATVMSNAGLDEALRQAGGKVIRAGVGDRYVMEEMKKRDLNFGGEQSGHFIFRDHGTTGDGILSAVQLLAAMRRRGIALSEARKVMNKFPQVQRNVRVREKPPLAEVAGVGDLIRRQEAELGASGRILVRYSGTEPLLRILVEGPDVSDINGRADAIAAAVTAEIGFAG